MKISLIIAFLSYAWFLQLVHSCQTPDGKSGECMVIDSCAFLSDMMTPNITVQDKIFISRYMCGNENGEIMVCCPEDTLDDLVDLDSEHLPQIGETDNTLVDRIYGGNVTKITDFPSMALIKYETPYDFELGCGGTLISDRYVVTAGHCVHKDNVFSDWTAKAVRLGEWDTSTEVDCDNSALGEPATCSPPFQDILISNIIIHPKYNSNTLKNDIALLRMGRRVRFSTYIKPVSLPLTKILRRENLYRQELVVVGFGRTETARSSNKKMKLFVNGSRMKTCRTHYINGLVSSTNICAGGEEGKDSCNGDSGGPLYRLDTKTNPFRPSWILVGIVSFGPTQCGLKGYSGVYTKVSEYIPFILSNISR